MIAAEPFIIIAIIASILGIGNSAYGIYTKRKLDRLNRSLMKHNIATDI